MHICSFLVNYVSESRGIQSELELQAVRLTAFGLGDRGWQLYTTIPIGALNCVSDNLHTHSPTAWTKVSSCSHASIAQR